MDFFNVFLAKIFEQFKTKSPSLAAGIILFLGTIIYWANNGLGDLIGYDLSKVVSVVSIVLGLLTGTHTTEVLKNEK